MRVTAGGPPISVSVVVVDPTAAVSHTDPAVAVTRVIPVLQLAYIEIVASALMDDSGLYQYKADIAVIVDSAALAFSHPESDLAAMLDAQLFNMGKHLADSVGVLDLCLPQLIYQREFDDTATAGDSSYRGVYKTQADAIGFADTNRYVYSKAVADAFAMNDLADIGDGIAFQFDEYTNNVVSATDATAFAVASVYADTATPTDAAHFAVGLAAADSITQPDLLAISFSGAYTDSATLTDNLGIGFARPVSDSFGQNDTTSLATAPRVADSVSFTETGSMFVQDYADMTYFAEQYVGTTYTF